MVNTRLSSHATRRRNLATIFDDSAQRHAVTPPTPLAAAALAANTATATFLATIRTLSRERFDESVATHVAKKILGGKSERFIGSKGVQLPVIVRGGRVLPVKLPVMVTMVIPRYYRQQVERLLSLWAWYDGVITSYECPNIYIHRLNA